MIDRLEALKGKLKEQIAREHKIISMYDNLYWLEDEITEKQEDLKRINRIIILLNTTPGIAK